MGKSKQSSGSSESVGTFDLILGEDTYSGQNAQSPSGARRVLSFVPDIKGELTRESGQALYLPTQLASAVTNIVEYNFNDTSGARQSVRFATTTTQIYKESGGAWVLQSLINPPTGVSTTSPFFDTPQFAVINNLLHIADGKNSWLYDGPNGGFVVEGLAIPFTPPGIVSTGGAGVINATIGKYYWYTYADETTGRVHESSSGPISDLTGALVNKEVVVTPQAGTVTTTIGNINFALTSDSDQSWVGMLLYVAGVSYGPIASVTTTSPTSAVGTLVNPAPASNVGAVFLIAPPRATHIHIYGSETDGSKEGKLHGKIAVTDNPPDFTDNTPFITDPTSTIQNVDRPIRNDPPFGSRILEVHKYRIFRRQETKPNFVGFSGNEEITTGNGNGSPQESNPGQAGASTASDLVDIFSYPQSANRVRALKSHADALWIGTEDGIVPLYGNSIDDFGLMQIVTIDGGVISRWGMCSTSHGLVIFGYDKLLKNYPPISPIYAVTPQDVNVTDQLVEIGRPMRNKFLAIKSSDIDNVRILNYRYNTRDWLVVCWQDSSSVRHTYIYDWPTKSWWESQRGMVSVAVFEPTAGNKILVGGGSDGFVYVIDDPSGTYVNATFPAALFRTALINFGRPDLMHVPEWIEYEVSNPNLGNDVTVKFYLDPQNADSPGTALGPMNIQLVPDSASRYRAYFSATDNVTGVTCKRLMVEISLASSANAGALRGLLLKSTPIAEEVK